MDPSVQVLNPTIEVGLVVLPSQPINPGRRISLESKECGPKHRYTEMVEKRGEPLLPPLPCDLSYALQRLGHACPVLRPARALLLAFPSAPALGSTNSAASRLALFIGFTATMTGSDFSHPYITGDGSSPSRCGPRSRCVIGRTRDLPVPAQRASAHARVSDHAGPSGHSRSRARPCCLPRSETRRHPGF